MKKILVVSDSFKGTLSSKEIVFLCQKVIRENQLDVKLLPFLIADGGEGSIEAFSSFKEGTFVEKIVKNANGKNVKASYFKSKEEAIIEVASVIGLPHTSFQNPLLTSSFGVGELILDAISKGSKKILIALGGSSTNDGGAPILACLGAKFFDVSGKKIEDLSNQNLSTIVSIDLSDLRKTIQGVEFVGLCDVNNPLLGPDGATYIYAPQKGARRKDLPILENGLAHYAKKMSEAIGKDKSASPRTGAAGGIGFALESGLNATLISGIEVMLNQPRFKEAFDESDLILSGEGSLDEQSFQGKVIDGLLKLCKKESKSLSLIVGSKQKNLFLPKEVGYLGITSKGRKDFEEIKKHAKEDYENAFLDFLKAKGIA